MIPAVHLVSALVTLNASPFGPGEELVFQVKTLGVKSGTAQFNVGAAEQVEGVSAWPIVMAARSTGASRMRSFRCATDSSPSGIRFPSFRSRAV